MKLPPVMPAEVVFIIPSIFPSGVSLALKASTSTPLFPNCFAKSEARSKVLLSSVTFLGPKLMMLGIIEREAPPAPKITNSLSLREI